MTDLIRRKQPGEAWETAVDTGGGGSQPGGAVTFDTNVAATSDGNLGIDNEVITGADFTVTDGDTVNLLTPGTYDVMLNVTVAGDATGAGEASIVLGGTIVAEGYLGTSDFGSPRVVVIVIPASFIGGGVIYIPALSIAATCTLQVAATFFVSAGELSASIYAGVVRRIA